MFESCVVSDGNQTYTVEQDLYSMFESCVVSDGNQTAGVQRGLLRSLRVVLFLMVTKP